jgi:hypothetical protein
MRDPAKAAQAVQEAKEAASKAEEALRTCKRSKRWDSRKACLKIAGVAFRTTINAVEDASWYAGKDSYEAQQAMLWQQIAQQAALACEKLVDEAFNRP